MDEPAGTLGDYIRRAIRSDDMSWQNQAACLGVSEAGQRMFMCIEEDEFDHNGVKASGLQVQHYVVEHFCVTCPVQWDCCRFAVVNEEHGVWGTNMRDRRWLLAQRNPLGIIDTARAEKMPISAAVKQRRLARQRHPSMRRAGDVAV